MRAVPFERELLMIFSFVRLSPRRPQRVSLVAPFQIGLLRGASTKLFAGIGDGQLLGIVAAPETERLGCVNIHDLPRVQTRPHSYRRSGLGICGVPHDYVDVATATVRLVEGYDALTPNCRENGLARPDWS
jgi:hypothetical protein